MAKKYSEMDVGEKKAWLRHWRIFSIVMFVMAGLFFVGGIVWVVIDKVKFDRFNWTWILIVVLAVILVVTAITMRVMLRKEIEKYGPEDERRKLQEKKNKKKK